MSRISVMMSTKMKTKRKGIAPSTNLVPRTILLFLLCPYVRSRLEATSLAQVYPP